ncbi:unnamed protein product [Alopecurus aequalis]
MATAAVSPPPPEPEPLTPPDHLPRPSVAISWDSEALCKRAETCELESKAFLIDPALLPTLEGLLLELYAMLRPKPVDYEQRHTMIDIFDKIAKDIFGKVNGFPVVEPFGSFTMDLFTAKSDLDLSVNFSSDMDSQFGRKEKISAIWKFVKFLYKHRSRKRFSGVLPIVSAKVPVLKVTDKRTGVECDISVENKDGMSRSMIFKLVSSIDERFQIICFLMKFWAMKHDVNCPKERTMSSMAIISLVAFHLQTRHPPILPPFSGLLKDGADFASIQKNVLLFEGFGSNNKESVAELFVSLMSKLLAVEGLWEQGLCASNFDGFWISKTWDRGIGILSVEDFLDRSQNFARAVGKAEMQIICGCLRDSVSKLADFFKGNIDAPRLKILIFGALNQDVPVRHPSPKPGKNKRKRESRHEMQQKQGNDTAQPDMAPPILPTPTRHEKQQKKGKDTAQPDMAPLILPTPTRHEEQQKKGKDSAQTDMAPPILPTATRHEEQQKKGKHTAQPDMAPPILPTATRHEEQQKKGKHTAQPDMAPPILPTATWHEKQQKKGKDTAQPDMAPPILPTPTRHEEQQKKGKDSAQTDMAPPILPTATRHEKQQKKGKHTAQPGSAANMAPPILPTPTRHEKQQNKGKHTAQPGRAANRAPPILPAPIVFMPPPPVQQMYQFGPVPQHLMLPPRFAYGLHSHPAPHMIGQPQGSFIHLNPGIQQQQQAQHMFGSLLAHQRAIDGSFHPYGFNGAQRIYYDENGLFHPYGFNGVQRIHYDENGPLPYGINPNYRRI